MRTAARSEESHGCLHLDLLRRNGPLCRPSRRFSGQRAASSAAVYDSLSVFPGLEGDLETQRWEGVLPHRYDSLPQLSSLGVYSGKLEVPLDAFGAGIADIQILTTLCPGGKRRMRRLMELVASGRLNLKPLLTHEYDLDSPWLTFLGEVCCQLQHAVLEFCLDLVGVNLLWETYGAE